MRCQSSRRVTATLILSFLTLIPTSSSAQVPLQSTSQQQVQRSDEHVFSLRHIFHRGLTRNPDLHKRLDIRPQHEFVTTYEDEAPEDSPPPRLTARSNTIQIERLADRRHEVIAEHLGYSSYFGAPRILDSDHWTMDEIPGPNITDKETVVNLALMAANAYVPKYGESEWENVGQGYNLSTDFGWEGDGLRGHIFADEGNKTIIVGLKGTSPAVFDGDGTTTNDKLNDNLFFSCCCGQGGQFFWRAACDCYSSTYSCNSTCLIKSLKQKTKYYTAAMELYTNVTDLYPDSNIWVVGHSLGGAVSSLIGLTYGLPVVTYEAPGDALAAQRLGLPLPSYSNGIRPFQKKRTGAVHFGHTADPIFMGTCNGATSPCTLGGYAMESQCHTGVQCVYDTVGDKGWRVGLGYHRIHDVIDNVIRKYDKVATCEPDSECVDCFNWKFFKSNSSDSKPITSKTTTATTTRTRTTTCKTPGWWGCLDETTTSSSKPIVTTTFTTTSCATPGWFGCKEEVNITITTTTASPTRHFTTTTSTTCKTPGWFGCEDETATTTKHSSTHTASKTTSHQSCETPGLFWGCHDKTTSHSSTVTPSITPPPSTTILSSSTSTTTSTHQRKKRCKHPALFGLICLD